MWYPAKVIVAANEPISIAMARTQCRVEPSDTDFDGDLTMLIASARSHVEKYCATRFGSQTIEVKCDSFSDFARLSESPVSSILSITYIDGDGNQQTLDTNVYELRSEGLESSIVLKSGQSWVSIQSGSRITVTAIVGFDETPKDVIHAMLIFIAEHFENKENALGWKSPDYSKIDVLLCNHRRGI